jgi:hypothetical protein
MVLAVTRVPTPPWAGRSEVYLHGMRLSDYERIQSQRLRLLEALDREIHSYLNSEQVLNGGAFPDRARLTGVYYVARESYTQHVGPPWVQVGFSCHCLGQQGRAGEGDFDYLGLDVWLRCDDLCSEVTVFRNTDSSVI